MNARAIAVLAFAASSAVACADRGSTDRGAPGGDAPGARAALGGQIVARVGDVDVPVSLVERVAEAQGVTASAALDALIADAIAAQGARARGLDAVPAVHRDLRAALAGLVADRLRDASRAAGLPSDAEVAELSALHADDVDRPEAVRVVHAIALRPKDKSADTSAERAVAAALEAAARDAATVEAFEERTKAVPHPGVDVRVERLPGFARDGRIVEGGGAMDATFAAAAHELTPEAPTSKIVETVFGWHVIRLGERLPARVVPLEERRAMFSEEAQAMRARRAYDARMSALRAARAIEVRPEAETVMGDALRDSER